MSRLEDLEAARSVLHRYALAVDTLGAEAVAEVWAADGILRTRMGDFVGRAAVAGFFGERFAADPSRKRHFVLEPLLTWVEPGLVHNTSYFLFTAQGQDSSILGWGTYDDEIRIVDGEAQFALRHIQVVAAADPTQGWPLPRD